MRLRKILEAFANTEEFVENGEAHVDNETFTHDGVAVPQRKTGQENGREFELLLHSLLERIAK